MMPDGAVEPEVVLYFQVNVKVHMPRASVRMPLLRSRIVYFHSEQCYKLDALLLFHLTFYH